MPPLGSGMSLGCWSGHGRLLLQVGNAQSQGKPPSACLLIDHDFTALAWLFHMQSPSVPSASAEAKQTSPTDYFPNHFIYQKSEELCLCLRTLGKWHENFQRPLKDTKPRHYFHLPFIVWKWRWEYWPLKPTKSIMRASSSNTARMWVLLTGHLSLLDFPPKVAITLSPHTLPATWSKTHIRTERGYTGMVSMLL